MQRAKMKKQIIKIKNAPSAIGPYNQAVKAGDTVYISGQIPLDHASGKLVDSSFPDQVNNCLLYTSPSPRDKRQSRMPSSA